MSAVIDLPRIRRALSELDRIAEAHPEMCQGIGQWDEKAVEKIIMGTPAKDRVKAMRGRLAAQGIKREVFFATPEAQTALAELRALHPDKTRDNILCDAVICLLAAHQQPAPATIEPSPATVPDLPADRAELARRGHELIASGMTAAAIAEKFNAAGWTPDKIPKVAGGKPRSDSATTWTAKMISQLLNRDHPANC
jgi:hypothetical protein